MSLIHVLLLITIGIFYFPSEGVWPCAHSGKDRLLVRYWRCLRGSGSYPGRDKNIRISVYGLLGDKPSYRHSLDHTIEISERACRGGGGVCPNCCVHKVRLSVKRVIETRHDHLTINH